MGQIVFSDAFDYTAGNDTFLSESSWGGDSTAPFGAIVTGQFSTANLNPVGSTDKAVTVFGGDSITSSVGFTASFNTNYFFSYMIDTNSAETSRLQFRSSNNRRIEVGMDNNEFGVGVNTSSFGVNGTTTVANSQEYFVVGAVRVDDDGAGTNQDSFTIVAKLFTGGAAAQAWAGTVNTTSITASDWDFHEINSDFPSLGNAAYAFDSITLTSNNGVVAYDEIRIATDLASVAVPEPSTYALLAGFATLGLVVLRRRRVR
jgi:hypothetical protein